jgi:transcriptional regulator with XRE-family HTH domain
MRHYPKLGRAIAEARLKAGLATQRDLAVRLGVAQQSVSRWEAGTHRPGLEQIGELAQHLALNADDLRLLAGFGTVSGDLTTTPFPLETLGGEEFEQFVADLAKAYFAGADVRRAGKQGHRQDGIDVEVRHPDGSRTVIQCKRTARFGQADVREVAERLAPDDAARKILALGRVASPQAAAAAHAAGLEMWDKDDLSRIIRTDLGHQAQERLVDTYFRNQRLALLGVPEPGPWMSAGEFFAPFQVATRGFSHAWPLIGRQNDLNALAAAIDGPMGTPVLLVAAAGMGKSRLLAAWADQIQGQAHAQGRSLYFLSTTADLKRADLARLGPGPKILVVDDAHDRDGMGALFEFAADPSRQVRIVLATRPYAIERITGELAISGLGAPQLVTLGDLTTPQLIEMAQEVLGSFGRPRKWAQAIVQGAGGSPLVALMAARVVARDPGPMEQARSDAELRAIVLSKFARVLVGDLGDGSDDADLRDVLGILALVQPFHPEDRDLLALIEQVTGVGATRASAAMRRLLEGGIAYSRGRRWRLMPDVLGDYLIETSCLDAAGKLSPFAQAALTAAGDAEALMTNVMVNLGRLDWRRSKGDTSASDLLAGAWRSLDTIQEQWDRRLNAVKAVAYYQPDQALNFVARQLRRGRTFGALADILRNVAVGSGKLEPAAGLLWEMGRLDGVEDISSNPALRTLTELCGYHPYRSLSFPEQSLAFGLALVERQDAWSGKVTPLDILASLLSTEGTTTRSTGRHFSISPYFIDPTVVASYRNAVITKVLELLRDPRLRVARAAAETLRTALSGPIGRVSTAPPSGASEAYEAEALQTLERLEAVVREGVHPLVAVGVETAIRWRLRSRKDAVTSAVKHVLAAIHRDLEFDLRLVMGGDAFDIFRYEDGDYAAFEKRFGLWLDKVAAELRQAEPDPEARRARIEALLLEAQQARAPDQNPYRLIHPSLRHDNALAEALLSDALRRSSSLTRDHVDLAIGVLTFSDKARTRAWVRKLITSGDPHLMAQAARGFGGGSEPDDEDLQLMTSLVAGSDPRVVKAAIQTISWSGLDPRRKLQALLESQVLADDGVADGLATALVGSSGPKLLDLIEADGVDQLLAKLAPVPRFEKYWVDKLLAELSARFPHAVAAFFRRRVEMAAALDNYSFRAANTGPYSDETLRVLETPQAPAIMAETWTWMLANDDRGQVFRWAALDVVEAMFLDNSAFLARFLEGQLPHADPRALKLASEIIRRADHGFVFAETEFVIAFLERCEAVDLELLERVVSNLAAGASEGMRSGTPGEPYPRDLADRQQANAVLARLSRLSPAYELFEDIRLHAEGSIRRALQDAEHLDDDE